MALIRKTNNLQRRLKKVSKFAERLPPEAHTKFVQETPVDTGNARRNTKLRGNEIRAEYDYSIRLEKQSWSKQAPNGMSQPTIVWIREQLKKL